MHGRHYAMFCLLLVSPWILVAEEPQKGGQNPLEGFTCTLRPYSETVLPYEPLLVSMDLRVDGKEERKLVGQWGGGLSLYLRAAGTQQWKGSISIDRGLPQPAPPPLVASAFPPGEYKNLSRSWVGGIDPDHAEGVGPHAFWRAGSAVEIMGIYGGVLQTGAITVRVEVPQGDDEKAFRELEKNDVWKYWGWDGIGRYSPKLEEPMRGKLKAFAEAHPSSRYAKLCVIALGLRHMDKADLLRERTKRQDLETAEAGIQEGLRLSEACFAKHAGKGNDRFDATCGYLLGLCRELQGAEAQPYYDRAAQYPNTSMLSWFREQYLRDWKHFKGRLERKLRPPKDDDEDP